MPHSYLYDIMIFKKLGQRVGMGILAYEEYYTVADYENWELIRGMSYAMTPSLMFDHQYMITKIARILDEKLDKCPNCYPVVKIDWQISEDTVVRPDVLVVCKKEQRITTTPKIIFEVVSKTSIKRDEQTKFNLFEKEGVKYYALVYHDQKRVKVYQHINFKYQKIADFSNEGVIELQIENWDISFDTRVLWKKL